jgi:hypothetical protein
VPNCRLRGSDTCSNSRIWGNGCRCVDVDQARRRTARDFCSTAATGRNRFVTLAMLAGLQQPPVARRRAHNFPITIRSNTSRAFIAPVRVNGPPTGCRRGSRGRVNRRASLRTVQFRLVRPRRYRGAIGAGACGDRLREPRIVGSTDGDRSRSAIFYVNLGALAIRPAWRPSALDLQRVAPPPRAHHVDLELARFVGARGQPPRRRAARRGPDSAA